MKNLSKKITIAIVGRSGSGKGTQAELILKKLGKSVHYVGTGKIIRGIMDRKNPTAEVIRNIIKHGNLVPSWFAEFLWISEFVNQGIGDKDLLFDGSPRTVGEAEIMDEVMEMHGRPLPLCVYVDADEAKVTERLTLRGRADDTPVAIKNRMDYFSKQVIPTIEYYKKKDRLIRVDGNGKPEEVWEHLDNKLRNRLKGIWR